MPKLQSLILLLAGLGLAVACAAPTASQPSASSPGATVRVASASVARTAGETSGEPPAVIDQAPQPEPLVYGTYPGPYVRGRADAPVTVEEYADFQ